MAIDPHLATSMCPWIEDIVFPGVEREKDENEPSTVPSTTDSARIRRIGPGVTAHDDLSGGQWTPSRSGRLVAPECGCCLVVLGRAACVVRPAGWGPSSRGGWSSAAPHRRGVPRDHAGIHSGQRSRVTSGLGRCDPRRRALRPSLAAGGTWTRKVASWRRLWCRLDVPACPESSFARRPDAGGWCRTTVARSCDGRIRRPHARIPPGQHHVGVARFTSRGAP